MQDVAYLRGRADRNRRLSDHETGALEVPGERARRRPQRGEVGGVAPGLLRRTDAQEVDRGIAAAAQLGSEGQPARRQPVTEQRVEPRPAEWSPPPAES